MESLVLETDVVDARLLGWEADPELIVAEVNDLTLFQLSTGACYAAFDLTDVDAWCCNLMKEH